MSRFGEQNHNWKYGDASYSAAHYRVRTRRGKPWPCEHCGNNDLNVRHEWALKLDGDLFNADDYIALCKPCHAMYDVGSHVRGEKVNSAKLTDVIVEQCINRYNAGERAIDLAIEFDVSKHTMWKAIRGETWKHVHQKMRMTVTVCR